MTPYYERDGVTIYHGDCREIAEQIANVDALISDPPYGMKNNCDYTRLSGGTGGQRRKKHLQIHGDSEPFDPSPWLHYRRVVLWGWNHYAARTPVGTTLVWVKRYEQAYGTFLSDAEVAWMKGGHGVYLHRDTSLFGQTRNRRHPTEKPVGLMRWCIQKAKANGLILDPYMGSGPTLVAAVELGLPVVGIEIEERYCEIAAKRLDQMVLPLEVSA